MEDDISQVRQGRGSRVLQTGVITRSIRTMLVSLFQVFEFAYPDGLLFYDRSGTLSRRLQEIFPGLTLRNTSLDQRDFVLPVKDLELFFGVALARIQTLEPGQEEFPSMAAHFLQLVTEVLEINQLKDFHFRYVLGKPCDSVDEAQKLMWPLVDKETQAKLHSLAEPARWQALQGEFLVGDLACLSRLAIVDVVPHRKLAGGNAESSKSLPHITFHVDFRGLAPVSVAGFDVRSFIQNVRDNQAREILAKLAPHLT